MALRQLSKPVVSHLLDYIPKLKINRVEYYHDEVKLNCSILYVDHIVPLGLSSFLTKNSEKYIIKCIIVDKIIDSIQNKIMSRYILVDTFMQFGDFHNDEIIITSDGIKVGPYKYSFDCSNAIIELLEYTKLFGLATHNEEYIEKLYNIYMKYYPDSKIPHFDSQHDYYVDRDYIGSADYYNSADYLDDLKQLFKEPQYYDHKKYDFNDYEKLCQTGKINKYFPIYICHQKECFSDMKNYDKAIVAMNWKASYCQTSYDSTDINIVYLFEKNEND